jgi:hypothetical protein
MGSATDSFQPEESMACCLRCALCHQPVMRAGRNNQFMKISTQCDIHGDVQTVIILGACPQCLKETKQ